MWRPLLVSDTILTGMRLKKELSLGTGDLLWTEYEVIEAGEMAVLLRPLRSCGREWPDDTARYKKMSYEFLHNGSTRVWDIKFGDEGWMKYRSQRLKTDR